MYRLHSSTVIPHTTVLFDEPVPIMEKVSMFVVEVLG